MGTLRRIRRQSGKSGRLPARPTGPGGPERIELQMSELEAILERSKTELLNEQDCERLRSVLQTLYFLTQELEKNRVSVQRLKQLLFGAATEKTRTVLKKALAEAGVDSEAGGDDTPRPEPSPDKVKGHGRHGAGAYGGGEKVQVAHPSLQGGDTCPRCKKGKVYEMTEPGRLVRIRGQAPGGHGV